jgi:hypothetical protein
VVAEGKGEGKEMNKVAIAFLTKDRVELSKRSIVPLLQPDKFDLFWIDGSNTVAGIDLLSLDIKAKVHANVKGGADPAVAYALTEMLKHDYTHIGLVENDTLLHADWLGPTMALFERGATEGLSVGAASARCYVDRILCQRDGYALMHNLGWGMQILTREAATLTLKHFRTAWTLENRRVFAQLSGIDIGSYWAFKAGTHWLTPDWHNDAVLASHGLASLALVPSPVEMIGQRPPLAEQGLKLAIEAVEDRRNDEAFSIFAHRTGCIRDGLADNGIPKIRYRDDTGVEYVFAHQLDSLSGAQWSGDWRLKWSPGFGGFAAKGTAVGGLMVGGASCGDSITTFECYISGPVRFLVMGGEKGGQVQVEDLKSKYVVRPTLLPEASSQMTQVMIPAVVSWRPVRLTVLSGTATFYGLQCSEPQPTVTSFSFDHSELWPL